MYVCVCVYFTLYAEQHLKKKKKKDKFLLKRQKKKKTEEVHRKRH